MHNTTAALQKWMEDGGSRIGQIAIARQQGGWELRHVEDLKKADLAGHFRWQDARHLANLDDAGRYRALKTAPTLRHGWRLLLDSADAVHRALDYFYPAMLGLWLAHEQGEVAPVPLRETLGRQTGMYRVTAKITDEQAQSLIGRVCEPGACIKTIQWEIAPGLPISTLGPEKFETSSPGTSWPLLCQEACNLLVAAARKTVKGEAAE